jgi:hypothetical protein
MQQLVVHAKVEIIKRIVFSFLVNLTLVNNHSPKFHVIHKEPCHKLSAASVQNHRHKEER